MPPMRRVTADIVCVGPTPWHAGEGSPSPLENGKPLQVNMAILIARCSESTHQLQMLVLMPAVEDPQCAWSQHRKEVMYRI